MPLTHPTRRAVLTGALAGGALAVLPSVPAHAGDQSSQSSAAQAVAFLDAMSSAYPASGKPTLPQSYADELGLFSTSFVYDAAVATCAALAAGRTALARRIGDGLLFAQAHDPVYHDGRLRQAYNVGPYVFYDGNPSPFGLVLPDGTANIAWQFGFLGTAVGDLAWPGIALVRLYAETHDRRYLEGARQIAMWITTRAVNPGTLGGFRFGTTAGDAPIPNVSTEHNIDCVAFFTMLDRVDRADWSGAATKARAFVLKMWQGQFFWTGSNDGTTINMSPIPLDPQTWSWLAMLDEGYLKAPLWAAEHLWTTDVAGEPHSQLPAGTKLSGVTFSSASLTSTAAYNGITVNTHGVWCEGSAQLACALQQHAGSRASRTAKSMLFELANAQQVLGRGQHVGGTALGVGGLVAATSLIDTGFGFGYFQVQHVGATAWYVMAALDHNPMRL
ncbi:MAG: hypothetical protein ACOH16_10630 [Propionibacteriaceae bacterium]